MSRRHPKEAGDILVALGRRLRAARQHAGVSLGDLAYVAGVTPQQIWKIEHAHNHISAVRLFIIAKALGLSVDYFFMEEL